METMLEEENAEDWVYKGEGAANLILTYRGSDPYFIGKVLRVKKVSKEEIGLQLSMHEESIWGNVAELMESQSKDILLQKYVTHIMCPLLGKTHIDSGVRVSVSKEFLEQIENNCMDLRPNWRVKASRIDTLTDSALLMSDHSVFPGNPNEGINIAVEIKPKCGFLPTSEYISESNSIKKQVTRYKMHQALKLHKKEISEESEYNPLDLFSRSKDRINKAIKALFNAPQNNFRVFINGSLIYGGNTNISFEEIINTTSGLNLNLNNFFDLITESIYKSDAINQLLKTQKLDSYDIEGAIHAYYDVTSQPCPICKNIFDDNLLEKFKKLHSLPMEKKKKIVRNYLVSATAKDCSIMISFRPKLSGSNKLGDYESVCINSMDQVYDYKMFFIDLDMKPLDRMVHYHKLDKEIVKFYKQNYDI